MKVMHTKTKDQSRSPTKQLEVHKAINQQQQNHCRGTDRTASCATGGLKAFYWSQIVALDFVVVKTTIVKLAWKLPNLRNASSQRNNLIKLTNYDETKKLAYDSHITRAIENRKESYGGPSQRQSSGTNQRIKVLGRLLQ